MKCIRLNKSLFFIIFVCVIFSNQSVKSQQERDITQELIQLLKDARNLHASGRLKESEEKYKKQLWYLDQVNDSDELKFPIKNELALVYLDEKKYSEAEQILLSNLEISIKNNRYPKEDVSDVYINLSKLSSRQGKLDEADKYVLKAKDLYTNSNSPKQEKIAEIDVLMAANLIEKRKFQDAIIIAEAALKGLGDNPQSFTQKINLLYQVSQAQQSLGKFNDTQRTIQNLINLISSNRGTDNIDYAKALELAGSNFNNLHNFIEAIASFKNAILIYDHSTLDVSDRKAHALNNMSIAYAELGEYSLAEQSVKDAIEIWKSKAADNELQLVSSYSNLASILQNEQRFSEAESIYRKVGVILEKNNKTKSREHAKYLNLFGVLRHEMGEASKADEMTYQSIQILENLYGPQSYELVAPLSNLADSFENESNYIDALKLRKRINDITLASYGNKHPLYARSLREVASIFSFVKDYKSVVELLELSKAIDENTDQKGLANPGTISLLASAYDHLNRYADGDNLYLDYLIKVENSSKSNNNFIWNAYTGAAKHYIISKKYPDAEKYLKLAQSIRFDKSKMDELATVVLKNQLAIVLLNNKKLSEAKDIVLDLISSNQALAETSFPVIKEAESASLIDKDQSIKLSFRIMQRDGNEASRSIKDAEIRETLKFSGLSDLVRSEQNLERERSALKVKLNNIISNYTNSPTNENLQLINTQVDNINVKIDNILKSISQKYPQYASLKKLDYLDLEEFKKMLSPDEALVSFYTLVENDSFASTSKTYAWVITSNVSFWTKLDISGLELSNDVINLRKSLTFEDDKKFDVELSYKLYRSLFSPLENYMRNISRIAVFSNGAFSSLPPALLIMTEPGSKSLKDQDWLINKYSITIIPSVYSYQASFKQAAKYNYSKQLIAFGDPVLTVSNKKNLTSYNENMRSNTNILPVRSYNADVVAKNLRELPGTRKEIIEIAKNIDRNSNDIYLGQEATETKVKKADLTPYKVIYFATHNLVSSDFKKLFNNDRILPGLILSTPNKESSDDDGILQSNEISRLNMNAEWVVLSACNTASSNEVGGEVFSGIASAFLYAGAKSLLASHWEVSDDATVELMKNIFNISIANVDLTHGEILRKAILAILNKSKNDYEAHPRFWAPFVVVGEPPKNIKSL